MKTQEIIYLGSGVWQLPDKAVGIEEFTEISLEESLPNTIEETWISDRWPGGSWAIGADPYHWTTIGSTTTTTTTTVYPIAPTDMGTTWQTTFQYADLHNTGVVPIDESLVDQMRTYQIAYERTRAQMNALFIATARTPSEVLSALDNSPPSTT